MGTSHRQPPVKQLVGAVRAGLTELFGLPDGWEVVLGNGGTTMFWDVASFGLVERRSQHLVFGEFSSKFAEVCAAAPHLDEPHVVERVARHASRGRSRRRRRPVRADPQRDVDGRGDAAAPAGRDRRRARRRRRHVRGRRLGVGSGAGRRLLLRPAEVLRLRRRAVGGRLLAGRRRADQADRRLGSVAAGVARPRHRPHQQPPRPDLQHAGRRHAAAARCPAAVDARIGGLDWCVKRSQTSSGHLYGWAEARPWATPFVADPAQRSAVVGTIDLDGSLDADKVCAALRANGIVDTDSYRKLGRNQLRIGMFPAIDPADVEALTACIDHLVDHYAEALAPMTIDEVLALDVDELAPLHRPVMLVGLTGWFDVAGAATAALAQLTDGLGARSARSTPTRSTTSPRSARPSSSTTARTAGSRWPSNDFRVGAHAAAPTTSSCSTASSRTSPGRLYVGCARRVVERLGCEAVVTLGATADAVPHTRMPPVVGSTTDPELARRLACRHRPTRASPGWSACCTCELERAGVPAISLRVGVPHYLTHIEHPLAVARPVAAPRPCARAADRASTSRRGSRTVAGPARRDGRRRRAAAGLRADARDRVRPTLRGGAPHGRRPRRPVRGVSPRAARRARGSAALTLTIWPRRSPCRGRRGCPRSTPGRR